MKFCEYIKQRLLELGYSTIFGVPGSYIMPIWQQFGNNIKVVLARNEAGAAYMADGWSRITGKPGIVLTTIGPGITNSISGVASAYKDSVPLLVITGQASTNSYGRGVFQESFKLDRGFNPKNLMDQITKASIEITNVENAPFLFEAAFKIAISGRPGPVHISVPYDIQIQEIKELDNNKKFVNYNEDIFFNKENYFSESFIQAINSAKRPLLLVGWGSYISGAIEEVEKLSEVLSCPIISTIKGISAVGYDLENYIGHIGLGADESLNDFLRIYDSDLLIILGASLSSYYFDSIRNIVNSAKCIQVDIEEKQIGLRHMIDFEVCSDVKKWIEITLPNLDNKENLDIKKKINKYRNELNFYFKEKIDNKLTMANAIMSLNKLLSKECVVMPDAGNHWLNTLSYFRPKRPKTFFINSGLGTMGHAISCIIGMKFAEDKRFICITGDGSVLMSGNEISVSVENKLNNIYIIFNNCSMGRVRIHQLQACNKEYISSSIENVDFKKWAESMGAVAYKANNMNEYMFSIKKSLKTNKTCVIEVIVDKDEIPKSLIKS